MSTTGTTSFNLDMNDLIEEAFERTGLELRSGYDFRTARKSPRVISLTAVASVGPNAFIPRLWVRVRRGDRRPSGRCPRLAGPGGHRGGNASTIAGVPAPSPSPRRDRPARGSAGTARR